MSTLDFREGHPSSSRVFGLAVVLGLHLLLVWALVSGLARDVVKAVQEPLQVALIAEVPKETPPAPPPPPEVVKPPEAYVPPPVVQKAPPVVPQKTIQQVQSAQPEPQPVIVEPQPVLPRADPSHGNTQPPYPAASRRMGEEGRVILLLYVDSDGRVTDGRVDRSSGYDRLDKVALMHARRTWRFLPATKDGVPVGHWMKFAVNFKLTDG